MIIRVCITLAGLLIRSTLFHDLIAYFLCITMSFMEVWILYSAAIGFDEVLSSSHADMVPMMHH